MGNTLFHIFLNNIHLVFSTCFGNDDITGDVSNITLFRTR